MFLVKVELILGFSFCCCVKSHPQNFSNAIFLYEGRERVCGRSTAYDFIIPQRWDQIKENRQCRYVALVDGLICNFTPERTDSVCDPTFYFFYFWVWFSSNWNPRLICSEWEFYYVYFVGCYQNMWVWFDISAECNGEKVSLIIHTVCTWKAA